MLSREIRLADGHTTQVAEAGDPSGLPLFHLHGTPGCRLQAFPQLDLYAKHGLRVLLFDRPGYARSPRRRGRTIADSGREVGLVADALGIDRFGVLGVSGGGSPAIACAAIYGARVAFCGSVVGVAPFTSKDDEASRAGMCAESLEELDASIAGEETLRPVIERDAPSMTAETFPVPPFAPPGFVDHVRRWRREMLASGIDGWVDDDLASVKPWGVDLSRIVAPTIIWAAEDDDLVPFEHGRRLAKATNGELVAMPGGHIAFLPRVDDILRRVRESWRA